MARGDINASMLGSHQRGGAVSDRDVETAVLRVLTTKIGLTERTVQLLQELAGERGEPGRPHAAVRRNDLAAIGKIPPMGSNQASGAPTMADYNALRDDVRRMYEAITRVAQELTRT